jgi:hypothetical protein
MKRVLAALALLTLAAALGAAQAEYSQQVLKQLGLTEEQVTKLADLQDQSQSEVNAAQADLAVQKAELTRLLVTADPDMAAVEKLVRAAAESDVKVKMSQIRRELAVRKVIGDRKWRQLLVLLRAASRQGAAAGTGSAAGTGAAAATQREQRVRALLRELLDLMNQPGAATR